MKDSKRKIPYGYWTIKENCQIESLKYKTRSEFYKVSRSAYNSSRKNGWLDEICNHMVEIIKPKNYWTLKNCRREALKYKNKKEFNKGSMSAYSIAYKNGWLDEICNHMVVLGNRIRRCIYSFEFGDNYAYVGLTYNIKMRYNEHMNNLNSSVYKHLQKTNLTPKFIQLTDYMVSELATKEETVWKNKYISNGWNMLNKIKTGGLGGGTLKWDYDSCKEEALKYKTIKEFREGCASAYNSSIKHGWSEKICSHMIKIIKPIGHWSIKENCRKEALKCKTRNELKKVRGAYNSSRKNGWLDEFFPKTKNQKG